jgi:Tol biopolymer transport system component
MTTERHLERDLPQILGDLAMGPYPDYIDDVLATTAHRRQRPAWTFPERWLPVDLTTQSVFRPTIPWRQLGVLALIALLLAAAAVFIGSQPRLPAPFGVARSGLVAFETGGDIYKADPETGVATPIVTGPETDLAPRFSRDGTHVVFERKLGPIGPGQLYVARSDGSGLTLVTPEPIILTPSLIGEPWQQYDFSPDGRSVLFASSAGGEANLSIAQSDGSGVRQLDVGIAVYEPSFRPPDGAEILFVGPDTEGLSGSGIFAVGVASGVVRTVIPPQSNYYDLAGAVWSPDGSQIAYQRWGGPGGDDGITAHTHVVSADGTGDRTIPAPPDAVWDTTPQWSNDGERLFIVRGYTSGFEDVRPVVIPADGTGIGIEIPYPGRINGGCCADWEWSPDDSTILVTPTDSRGQPLQQVIVDPLTGTVSSAPWTSTSDPTWQRLAP